MLSLEQRLKMLTCPTGKVDMVLDTDAYNEIDDQFAISYALRSPEKLNLLALYAAPFLNERSVSPLDGMEKSYDEILKLLHLAKEERLVFKGSGEYLKSENEPVISPAANDLAERAMNYSPEKPLYVVAIGAITNVASALLIQPRIADNLVVVWLGGNSTEWPDSREFNMMQDVTAARVLYGSGAPLVMLPCMGVVSSLTTTGPELTYWLSGKNALADYLARQTIDEANRYAAGKVWSRVIWDVAAVAWLLNDGGRLLSEKLIPTPIPEYDHHYGFDPRRPPCKYVFHINRDALFADLFAKLAR
ncbi:MAG: nucleoside hydrolase [Oscillospiraceae bacterium]|jgi:inosine-uridine nucleoside N-ribohydrolase|nr:nucleoside hydrolase [Oscillospiraceae bacterium]